MEFRGPTQNKHINPKILHVIYAHRRILSRLYRSCTHARSGSQSAVNAAQNSVNLSARLTIEIITGSVMSSNGSVRKTTTQCRRVVRKNSESMAVRYRPLSPEFETAGPQMRISRYLFLPVVNSIYYLSHLFDGSSFEFWRNQESGLASETNAHFKQFKC
jgi:hypothetical protein